MLAQERENRLNGPPERPACKRAHRYRTAFAGKWHIGFARPREFPAMRGFDVSSGIVGKSHHHFSWRVDKEFRDWAYDRNENDELDSDGTGGVADELNVDYFITGEDGVDYYVHFTGIN